MFDNYRIIAGKKVFYNYDKLLNVTKQSKYQPSKMISSTCKVWRLPFAISELLRRMVMFYWADYFVEPICTQKVKW